ncbi:hypothetical protein LPJ57_003313 [Coemansia sp. RSA 486]|nr:hypothetical protein LPJ57_003313 [Coemansia sp. RSA 486]
MDTAGNPQSAKEPAAESTDPQSLQADEEKRPEQPASSANAPDITMADASSSDPAQSHEATSAPVSAVSVTRSKDGLASASGQTTPVALLTPDMPDEQDDDDEVCAICQRGDSTDDNLIVFCEGKCNLGFHQKCYGIEKIPPGDEPWYCDWCAIGNITTYSKNLYCCHYKNDKTARTLVVNNGTAEPYFMHVHVQCAAWIPSVDTNHIPFTTSLHRLKACKNKCYFCGSRYGFQVECSHKGSSEGCTNTYHPMCAMRYRFHGPPPIYNIKYTKHLCPRHASKKLGQAKRRRASDAGVNVVPKRLNRRQSALPFASPRTNSNDLMDTVSPSSIASKETSASIDNVSEHGVGRLPSDVNGDASDETGTPQSKQASNSGGNLSGTRPRFRSGRRIGRPRGRSRAPGRQHFYDQVLNQLESEVRDLNEVEYDYKELEYDEDNYEEYDDHLRPNSGYVEQEVVDSGSIGSSSNDSRFRSANGLANSSSAQHAAANAAENRNGGSAQGNRITLKFNNAKSRPHDGGNGSISDTTNQPIAPGSLPRQSNVAGDVDRHLISSNNRVTSPQTRAQSSRPILGNRPFVSRIQETNASSPTQPRVQYQIQSRVQSQVQPSGQPRLQSPPQPCVQGQIPPRVQSPGQPRIQGQIPPRIQSPGQPRIQGQAQPRIQSSAQHQVQSPGQHRVQGQAQTPSQYRVQGQVQSPAQYRVQGQVQTPVQHRVQSPAQSQVQSRAQTPVQSQAQPRAQIPAQNRVQGQVYTPAAHQVNTPTAHRVQTYATKQTQTQASKQTQTDEPKPDTKEPTPQPSSATQSKRPFIRVRPFVIGSGTPPSGLIGLNHPLSAGTKFGPPLSALEMSQKVAAAAAMKLPEEQETMIKESHDMLQKQNELLENMHRMLKDMSTSDSKQTQQTQQALSTISSLSALVSNNKSNGTASSTSNGLSVGAHGAGDLNSTGVVGPNGGVLALPSSKTTLVSYAPSANPAANPAGLVKRLGPVAGTAPQRQFSAAAELQLPQSSAPSPKLNNSVLPAQPKSLVEASSFGGLASRPSEGSAQSTPKSCSESITETQELDEMKDNIVYLIKAVNMPHILNCMLSPRVGTSPPVSAGSASSASSGPKPSGAATPTSEPRVLHPQLKTMLADLRQIGIISKDNVHEHLKVLVNNFKAAKSKPPNAV